MWQKCPICNGTGIANADSSGTMPKCTTCNGTKIISTVTGRPPTVLTSNDRQMMEEGINAILDFNKTK